jgi:hypothetical protein
MTPKEKALQLITRFQHPLSEKSDTDCLHIEVAKECALIAVDEILSVVWYVPVDIEYWQEVKQEIEKL